jgi:hypothetical protein
MTYEVVLRRGGRVIFFRDYFLDGFVPTHVIDMMWDRFVDEELGLCKDCHDVACRCHVMQLCEELDCGGEKPATVYRKLCPILFHDAFKPPWKIKELA